MAAGLAGWELIVLAPFVGSFLGVVIERLPDGEPLVARRSRCAHCGATLAVRDLVPLASWLATRGRCRRCGAWLGWFYPAVELAALAIAVVALWLDGGLDFGLDPGLGGGLDAWLDALLGWWLLALGWIDWRRFVLPDTLTLPLAAFGLAAAWAWAPGELADRAAGAACGFLALWGAARLYRRLRGRDGLGLGDAKLFAAAGAWVGASGLPSVLAGAALAALAAAAALRSAGRPLERHAMLPFGPFLAAATWLVWLLGPFTL